MWPVYEFILLKAMCLKSLHLITRLIFVELQKFLVTQFLLFIISYTLIPSLSLALLFFSYVSSPRKWSNSQCTRIDNLYWYTLHLTADITSLFFLSCRVMSRKSLWAKLFKSKMALLSTSLYIHPKKFLKILSFQ